MQLKKQLRARFLENTPLENVIHIFLSCCDKITTLLNLINYNFWQ